MKHQLTLILAAAGLALGTSGAATLDFSSLGGTLATGYTDPSGIAGLTITYTLGQDPGTTENSGFSGETGGMSLPNATFPDGHLAVGPGDVVTLDFSSTTDVGPVYIGFYDLDNNPLGGDEGVTVLSAEGSTFEPGSPSAIRNVAASLTPNIYNVGPVTPDVNGLITLTATSALDQADGSLSIGSGNGYFAFNVGTAPIPEPSSAMLGLIGLLGLAFRRRR